MVYEPGRFEGREYAAPMVRASSLPFREECLRFGASAVFTEELIDKKIISSYESAQDDGTVLFLVEKDDGRTVHFRPESTLNTVLQMGTADGVLASKAALKLVKYVSEVNINMGCPKPFSVSGGMGAALLSKPEVATDIVKTLRSTLPESIPVTCKIRYIGEPSDSEKMLKQTSEFMTGLINAGAEAITVHMRTVPMRPREPAIWSGFADLLKILPAELSQVPIIANGDFFTRKQIDTFRNHMVGALEGSGRSWCNSIMIARGAMWNPSIFDKDEEHEPDQVLKSFVDTCIRYKEPVSSVKWMLGQMMDGYTEVGGKPIKVLREKIHQSKSIDDMRLAIDMQKDESFKRPRIE
jgi:tRNA-dihydrouridine synthase 2